MLNDPVKKPLGCLTVIGLIFFGLILSAMMLGGTQHNTPAAPQVQTQTAPQAPEQYNDDPSYNDPWCLQGHRVPNSVEEMMRCESTESLKEYCSKSDKIPSNKIACDYLDQHRRHQ